MVNVFRKIRSGHFPGDRVSKYFFYAIGEVFLVVIGILLALYINNLNQEKKNRQDTIRLFIEIQKDLLNDIEELELASNWAIAVDSIADQILKGALTEEDYDNEYNRELYYFGRGTYPVVISDQSFKLLSGQKEKIPDQYDDKIKSLNSLYIEDKTFLEEVQEDFDVVRNEIKSFMFNNFDWPIDLEYGIYSEEAKEFFLKNPLYKRKILHYKDRARTKWFYMSRIQEKAIDNFFMLNSITRAYPDLPQILINLGFDKVYFNPEPYLGEYRRTHSNTGQDTTGLFELIKVNDFAYWRKKGFTQFYGVGSLLCELEKDSLGFIYTDDYTFKFIRDQDNKVLGFTAYNKGEIDRKYTKVSLND